MFAYCVSLVSFPGKEGHGFMVDEDFNWVSAQKVIGFLNTNPLFKEKPWTAELLEAKFADTFALVVPCELPGGILTVVLVSQHLDV